MPAGPKGKKRPRDANQLALASIRKEVESDEAVVIQGMRHHSRRGRRRGRPRTARNTSVTNRAIRAASLARNGRISRRSFPRPNGGRKRKADVREVVNGRSTLCEQRMRRVIYVVKA